MDSYTSADRAVPSLKRRIANLIERLSGNLVLAPRDVISASEQIHLTRLFKHLNVDCVFDVGANDGQYATMLRDSVGYRGPIISYEPIPDLADRMRKRPRVIQDGRWFIEELALDREAGPAVFHIAAEDQFSSLRTPVADQPGQFKGQNTTTRDVTVQRATLESEFTKWQTQLGFRRPFLKMDTQGNEMAIVEGAGTVLSRFVGVQTELAMRHLYEGAPDYAQMIGALQTRGFEPSAFIRSNDAHFPEMFDVDCILYNAAMQAG